MSKPSTNTADSETNDAVSLCREHTTSFIASHCRLQNIMDPNYRLNTLQSGLEYLEYVGEPIEMLPKDSRPCRLLKLCNMMEVLIIEDASSKRSAVTMSMDVGSACDPPALPGLAHLCMHALLLRSDAGEATLEEYLKMHKGSIDLRISAERSLYSFEVANPGFADALSMFSKCFISPSFEPKNVGHKAELIDAIRRRDLEDDAKRAKMVCQLLAADSEGEPLRLSPGSCNSLAASARDSGIELRDKVSEFFHARYSAGIMKLAVVGHLPLDELTELVVTEFSRVPNKGITSDFHFGNPCSQAALGKAVFLHSVDCARRMHIYFPSLYLSEALSASTLSYITYLLNDQGEDSPFYALYHKGWVEHIFCQYEILGRASIPLQIGIDLTEDGLDNYQSVLGMVFTVLTLLARKTPDEAIFGELKQIRAGYFRMCPQKPPLDLAQLAARLMNHTHTPKYRLFSGNILLHEFSPKDVKESMEHLAPENCIVVIIGDHRLDCVEMEGFQEGAECSVLPIRECIKSCPLEQIEAFAAAARQPRQETQSLDYDLLLNNNIRSMRKYELEPTLLVHTKFGEVWYSKNTNLSNNEGKLGIEIIPPNSVKDLPNMTNITIVFSLLLKKRLKDIIDSKEHNSVEYALRPKHSGLSILVKGSIFKMLDVVKLILKHIQLAEFSEAEFTTALSDHIVNNSQAVGGLPDNHANKLANFIQDTSKAGSKTCTELETLDFDMFKRRVSEMFANFYFKVLAAGDFDQDMPLSVYDALINTLNPQPMAAEDIHPNSFLQQNVGRYIVQAKLPAGSYTGSAVTHTSFTGTLNDLEHGAYLDLISRLMHNVMHCKLIQTGCLGSKLICNVGCYSSNHLGLQVVIRSEHSPVYLQHQLDDFYVWFRDEYLANLSEEKLGVAIKDAIRCKKSSKKDMFAVFNKQWECIKSGSYQFLSSEQHSRVLLQATVDKVLAFWDEKLAPLAQDKQPHLFIHVYPEGLEMPAMNDRQIYADTIIALQECLACGGIPSVSCQDVYSIVAKIHELVANNGDNNSSEDDSNDSEEVEALLVERFKAEIAWSLSSADARQVASELAARKSHLRNALLTAVRNFAPKQEVRPERCEGQAVYRTASGDFVVEDLIKYKASLKLAEPVVSSHRLTPMYSDYTPRV